ncbi:MAG: hypothetical protein PHC39_02610 [Proteiniphilum sp.]|nr:hypothetical protein [Proteiniphilum sp.]MDD3908771.1 hypothetical protein [Proteiniphilum sp.]
MVLIHQFHFLPQETGCFATASAICSGVYLPGVILQGHGGQSVPGEVEMKLGEERVNYPYSQLCLSNSAIRKEFIRNVKDRPLLHSEAGFISINYVSFTAVPLRLEIPK